MAKLQNYTASVPLQSGLKAYDTIGDIPLMEAHSIQVDEEGKRLDAKLADLDSKIADIEENATTPPGETVSVSVYQRKITLDIQYANDRNGEIATDMPHCVIDINMLCAHNNAITNAASAHQKFFDIINFCKNKIRLSPMEITVINPPGDSLLMWSGVIQTITVLRDPNSGSENGININMQLLNGTNKELTLNLYQDLVYYMIGTISETINSL